MKTAKQAVCLFTHPMVAYAWLTSLYLLLVFSLPANQSTMEAYNLTSFGYSVVYFSLALPSLTAWFAAFFGYSKLSEYAASIKNTEEGTDFKKLALGAGWLAWSMPVGSILTLIMIGIGNKAEGFHSTAVILSNYINLLLFLTAFTIIGNASRSLVARSRLQFTPQSSRFIMSMFVLAGVTYCFLSFRWFDMGNLGSTANPYFLPFGWVLLTITIPYLYVWFVGLLSAYEINIFRRYVTGLLYKKALRYLVAGFTLVIISSIALQYVITTDPRFGIIAFDWRLLCALAFRIVRAIGFVMLILGALKLKKIEEV